LFVLFLFIVLVQSVANVVDAHDQIGQRSDDSQHFRAIDHRLIRFVHERIVASGDSSGKMP